MTKKKYRRYSPEFKRPSALGHKQPLSSLAAQGLVSAKSSRWLAGGFADFKEVAKELLFFSERFAPTV
jgi:hypothetical protein